MLSDGSGINTVPYNSTYSLDLSTSWSPSDAHFNVIDKGSCPVLNRPNLWPHPDGKSYYSFNGDVSKAIAYEGRHPPEEPQLWQFIPNGITNGTWRLAQEESSLIQSQSSRSVSGNGSAYILGGITTWRSAYGYDMNYVGSADGIISYDMQSQDWDNRSMSGLSSTGCWYEGELHWIDNLGGSGLVVALGGVSAQATPNLVGEFLVKFSDVTFFDPLSGEWRKQATTGDIPPARRRACSVGVPGDNGTYEVWLPLAIGGAPPNNDADILCSSDIPSWR